MVIKVVDFEKGSQLVIVGDCAAPYPKHCPSSRPITITALVSATCKCFLLFCIRQLVYITDCYISLGG